MSKNLPISIQLYTVRDHMKTDPTGTLERLAEIGYQGVEGSALGNSPEFVAKLQELDLQLTAGHTGLGVLENRFDELVEENQRLGNRFVVISYLDESERGSAQNWLETAKKIEDFGARLHEAGIQLCYHNHAFEFEEKFDGKCGFDLLLENTDSRYLQAEIDTYWVQKGGENPVEYLKKYADRTPLLHIKDMTKGQEKTFAEIGEGILDWPAIFAAAEAGAVTAYIVEQDVCPGDSLDSAAKSLENLKKMGKR